jgi:hypothetical protein
LGDPRVSTESKEFLSTIRIEQDPLKLLHEIRKTHEALVSLSTEGALSQTQQSSLEDFLAQLPELWKRGDARPTHQPEKQKGDAAQFASIACHRAEQAATVMYPTSGLANHSNLHASKHSKAATNPQANAPSGFTTNATGTGNTANRFITTRCVSEGQQQGKPSRF